MRFTIYTILRIANLRKYKVKLWYKKVFSNNQNQEESNEPEEEDIYSEAKTVSSSSETDEESESYLALSADPMVDLSAI